MNNQQKNALQIFLLIAIGVILFPPTTGITKHTLLLNISPFEKIDTINLLLRLIILTMLTALTHLYLGIPREKRLINVDTANIKNTIYEYFDGKKPLWKTFWIVTVIGTYTFYRITFYIFAPISLQGMFQTRKEFELTRNTLEHAEYSDTISAAFIVSLICLSLYTFWAITSSWRASNNHSNKLIKLVTKLALLIFITLAITISTLTLSFLLGYYEFWIEQ